MKAIDIILQLQSAVPQLTDKFSKQLSVSSLTISGSTITSITASLHGLTTGDIVNIVGAINPNPITDLTQVDNVATAITEFDHDLTLDFGTSCDGSQNKQFVPISGATESDYNGTKKLLDILNRRTFTFEVENDPSSPASGSPILEEVFPEGYNGLQSITVINPTTFTYVASVAINTDAVGVIFARKDIRISGVVDEPSILRAYTEQPNSDLWAFVVLENSITSKNRAVLSDATGAAGPGDDLRGRIIQNFSIYVAATVGDELAGRVVRDIMEDINSIFAKSLIGFKGESSLSEKPFSGVTFVEHSLALYDGGKYIHRFQYQSIFDITNDDSVGLGFNRAFRDLDFNFKDPLDNAIILRTGSIELDEEQNE